MTIDLSGDNTVPQPSIEDGALKTEHADGSATIDFSPNAGATPFKEDKANFYRNLADDIASEELDRIAAEILDGIQQDEQSRKEWLETRASGIKLLGLKIEEPGGDIAGGSAPLEGMSRIRHPLLLESTLRFQANARGELLPAAGPVKVRNDTPTKPLPPMPQMPPPMPPAMGHNGGPPLEGMPPPQPLPPPSPGPVAGPAPMMPPSPSGAPGAGPVPPMGMPPPQPQMAPPPPAPPAPPTPPFGEVGQMEELASALETDMNHYLTVTASEYYPDTDRMLFYVGFGGQGFKKVYNCPLRQRPVSESVDAEDIIVSNAATAIENCGRVTHKIKMRPSTLVRMKLIGAYRDVELGAAQAYPEKTVVDVAKENIEGIKPQLHRPQDAEHVIYECYCELDIKGFEHKKNKKPTGLQCPYKVTVHKESRKVLEVRRNWEKEDKLCLPKMYFVEFPFVRALGFYGIGLVHIAGNTTLTLTAAWREMLDAGMFANFPGFVYAKQAGRQLTNQFRVPPGGGIGIETGGLPISQMVMGLPYKEPGPAFTSFITHVEEVGQRVAGTAEMNIGEGTQEAPVGTTLALIEQATKVMDAVHKRLHAAQATEFRLLKDRFKEDPESFWRHNKNPAVAWRKEQFLAALNNSELVPVADPNNPTSMHRIAKAVAIKTLAQGSNAALYNQKNVDLRIMRIVGIDPEGLFNDQPNAAPPDPKAMSVLAKAQSDQRLTALKEQELKIKSSIDMLKLQDSQKDRDSRERLEQMKIQLERLKIVEEQIIHAHDQQAQAMDSNKNLVREMIIHGNDQKQQQQQLHHDHMKHVSGLASEHILQSREHAQNEKKLEIDRIKAEAARTKAAQKPASGSKK